VNDACYASSVDKIFGAVGPYVCKYNATTGAREGFVRVASPLYGEIRICYHAANSTIYAATWNEPDQQYFALTWPERDVFPVSTALVAGAGLGLGTIYNTQPSYNGFRWIGSSGSYIYLAEGGVGFRPQRVNPTNIADTNAGTVSAGFAAQQCGMSPTQFVNPVSGFVSQFRYAPILFDLVGDWSSTISVAPYLPVAAEYCAQNGLFYMVCGDTNLLRINVLSPINFTALNLGPVEATANPCRIRYRTTDQKLYLPCMTANTVIVWDPASETGIAKTGFDSPCDVVFTASKAFAVQQSPISLKEII